MNHRLVILSSLVGFALLLCASVATAEESAPNAPASPQAAVGTVFTYQGRLDQGGNAASGIYDFRFRLYDDGDAGEGTQLGEVEVGDVSVTSGLFSVELDFGSAFDTGTATWLEIGVRPGTSTESYTSLSPRQAVNAAPYALYARSISGSPYENVVVVAKSGGDTTTVQGAIDSITDASEDNPYLVWVAPGEYVESVTMKPYVHLQGASLETTVISSTVTNDDTVYPPVDATLLMTSSVTVRDLKIVNLGNDYTNVALLAPAGIMDAEVSDVKVLAQGTGAYNYAIYSYGSILRLDSVTGISQNGSSGNVGFINTHGSIATLTECNFTGWGGVRANGIWNGGAGTTLSAKNITTKGQNGTMWTSGLCNDDGAIAILEGGSFSGGSGNNSIGIDNWSGAILEAKHIYAVGASGTYGTGLKNYYSSAEVSYSVLEGNYRSVVTWDADSSSLNLSFSTLIGDGGFGGTDVCNANVLNDVFSPSTCP